MAETLEPFVVTSPLSEDQILFIDTSLEATKLDRVNQPLDQAHTTYLKSLKRSSVGPPTPYTGSSGSQSPVFSPSGDASVTTPSSSMDVDDEYLNSQSTRLLNTQDIEKLRCWNGNAAVAVQRSLYDLIRDQVLRVPTNIAIQSWDGTMTYDELDKKTSQLAHSFISKGVRPESVVPVVFEKSIWAVVAMIAALKAGAAFVAIEAGYPAERISNMIEQLPAVVIATSEKHVVVLRAACSGQEVLVIESQTFGHINITASTLLPTYDASSPAYLIFTSGSTGKPKGVVIEHSQASTSISSWSRILRMDTTTRSFNFSSFAFDASILDIFCPLVVGGCVCIPSEWSRLNDLAGAITDLQANFGVFTPSLLHSLRHESFPGLEKLLLVGEPISEEVYSHWSEERQKQVYCGYGPAEITLGCTLVDPERDAFHAGLLGHSFNSALWIADPLDSETLLPIGEVGELLVEGPIVARQYINNAEATRNGFITAPEWLSQITKRSGTRVYKTGDLVRYTSNGALIFEGRKDTQVKIHGQRVEIGEIEVALRKALNNRYPVAVEVKTSQFQTSASGLVAFIELPDDTPAGDNTDPILSTSIAAEGKLNQVTSGLKQILQKSLPCYMVPSEFVAVQKLPLTVASKLDRKRLRALASEERATPLNANSQTRKNSVVEHFSSTQEKIHRLWQRVLPSTVSNITLDTDFFNAGGDSLCVMNLVSLAREGGMAMDYALLRKASTIRELAVACNSSQHEEDKFDDMVMPYSLLPPNISAPDLKRQAAIKFLVDEDMIEDILPPYDLAKIETAWSQGSPGTWESTLCFPIAEGVDLDALKEVWEDMLREDPAYRTRYLTTGGEIWSIVLKADPVEVQTAPDVDTAMVAIRARGTDETQSILTYIIPKTATNTAQLMFATHHARWDGIGMQSIAFELDRRYRQQPIPKKRPFKSLLAYWAQQPIDRSDDFWRKQHAGAAYKPLIPAIPASATPSCVNVAMKEIPLTLPAGLEALPKNSIVFAAWGIVLAEEAGSPDAAVCPVRSGRIGTLSGIETTVAQLIQRNPLRIATKQSKTVHELVRKVAFDLEETRDHPILREDTFRPISPECNTFYDTHIMINFVSLPEAVPGDNLVGFPSEISHAGNVGAELGLPCILGGYMRNHAVTMLVCWDGRLLGEDRGHRWMAKFDRVLAQLMASTAEMKVDDVVVKV